jgi:predicted phosphodiesterase
VHDVKDVDFDPAEKRIHVVVSGHSHRPSIDRRRTVLFMNPGSAGPRRFKLPITVGRVTIHGSAVEGEIINLVNN